MKKQIGILLVLTLFLIVPPLQARDPGEWSKVTTEKVSKAEGNALNGLWVNVGSMSAISPYTNINWGDGNTDQISKFRSITVQNTSPYDVLCGTAPDFDGDGPSWVITKSTGSYTSWNYATFYMILGDVTASSVTIRGVIDRQK